MMFSCRECFDGLHQQAPIIISHQPAFPQHWPVIRMCAACGTRCVAKLLATSARRAAMEYGPGSEQGPYGSAHTFWFLELLELSLQSLRVRSPARAQIPTVSMRVNKAYFPDPWAERATCHRRCRQH